VLRLEASLRFAMEETSSSRRQLATHVLPYPPTHALLAPSRGIEPLGLPGAAEMTGVRFRSSSLLRLCPRGLVACLSRRQAINRS
jgi:hypothetical protein